MKYIPSIAFEEMSGSAKGVTAAKTRGCKYILNCGQGRFQAAHPELARAHQRADTLLERPREHPERQERPRHLFQDSWGEPLLKAQLLDSPLRRRGPQRTPGACRSGLAVRGRTLAHGGQLHLPAPRPAGGSGKGRPQASHNGLHTSEQRSHQGLLKGRDDRQPESRRR